MSTSVMIMGKSGSGKSRSLKSIDPKTSFLIQVIRKPLPFKGWRAHWTERTEQNPDGNVLVTDSPDKIRKIISVISSKKPDVKTVIIDDSQYIMANEFMRTATVKGFDKFTKIGFDFWEIVNESSMYRDDLTVFFLHHVEEQEGGGKKAKTIGKMLDEKISIEGMFTIVLLADFRDGNHVFVTKTNGTDTVKAPEGMFESELIENDLNQVIQAINAY